MAASVLPFPALQVWVTASTVVGEGRTSTLVSVVPSDTVGAGIWSVGGSVLVNWKRDALLQCRTVGVPEPSRTWTRGPERVNLNSPGLMVDNNGSLVISSVDRSASGLYTCTASNIHGTDAITYNVIVRVPPLPPKLHVTETTASSIRLQWDVEDEGGSRVTLFNLYYRTANGEAVQLAVQDNSHTIYGLECGTEYI
ncbi:Down syndrome cell adhesion molecule-like protein Dscam2 [Hyalella azteca]|uniref:Down syndrome cell adhesion molecule-like protein Dscam2 n=1 Tax=Hyalella azteca TaxID=294128 RepID=A0A8B7NY19_HYAAZ|nr:Down syndrome cell adhesion molecule-like protein Dscam2 [Hyalella azteca]